MISISDSNTFEFENIQAEAPLTAETVAGLALCGLTTTSAEILKVRGEKDRGCANEDNRCWAVYPRETGQSDGSAPTARAKEDNT